MKHPLPIFATLLLFAATAAHAQPTEFAPIGAKWWFVEPFCGPAPGTYGWIEVESMKDTLVGGQNARVLEVRYNEKKCPPFGDNQRMVMYGEEGVVYHWLNGEYYVLYDFNAQAGDTIYHQAGPYAVNDPITQVYGETANRFYSIVDSVSTLNIDGQSRRVLHFGWNSDFEEGDWGFVSGTPARAIEGIGSMLGLTGDWYRLDISLGTTYLGLVCYEDDIVHYDTPGWMNCDFVSSVEPANRPSDGSETKLFVDAGGVLHVQTAAPTASEYHIFDVGGNVVKKGRLHFPEARIDISGLPAGVYVFRLGGGKSGIKFFHQ